MSWIYLNGTNNHGEVSFSWTNSHPQTKLLPFEDVFLSFRAGGGEPRRPLDHVEKISCVVEGEEIFSGRYPGDVDRFTKKIQSPRRTELRNVEGTRGKVGPGREATLCLVGIPFVPDGGSIVVLSGEKVTFSFLLSSGSNGALLMAKEGSTRPILPPKWWVLRGMERAPRGAVVTWDAGEVPFPALLFPSGVPLDGQRAEGRTLSDLEFGSRGRWLPWAPQSVVAEFSEVSKAFGEGWRSPLTLKEFEDSGAILANPPSTKLRVRMWLEAGVVYRPEVLFVAGRETR